MKKRDALIVLACMFFASVVHAEDINSIFKKVNDLVSAQNYAKALDELKWASKEIEKLHAEKLKTFLPDQLAGYAGDKIQSANALGITSIERTYRQTDSSVKISLTNIGGAGSAGGMGGLAQLGQMAAMFGGASGIDTFRIQGRTATLENRDNGGDLTIYLESGSVLKLESQSATKTESLKAMAEALKLDDLDKYLKGQ